MYRLSSVALLLMVLWMSAGGSARGAGGRDGEVSALSPLAGTAWVLVLIGLSGQAPVQGAQVDAPVTLRQAERRSLVRTSWQVVAYNNGAQAVVSVLEGTRITARFGEDGCVAGSAGCNQYATAYETAEASVTIGHPETTRRACAEPEGVMAQEARFLEALRSAESFRLEGRKLTLRTAGKALAVTLVRDFAAPSPAETAPASKIRFDLERLDAEGLQGPPDGLRALHYEYCIPHRQDAVEEVTAIDPTLTIQQGSPGRIGCADEELLCLGHTHQPGFLAVLEQLAALPMVREIREAFFE